MQQKVLVIEDSSTSMKVLRKLIEKAGLIPVSAMTLTEARHIFNNDVPEDYLCALVDFNVPDAPEGESIDFTIESFIPTIVITGRLDQNTRKKILAKEIVDYIPKENAQVYEYLSRLMARLQKNKKIAILVVDDSRVSRTSVTSLLQRHNFKTYEASDGLEGLEALRQYNDIKLVLTDENMPNMNGVEMVAEMRRKYNKESLAIIGLSSMDSDGLSARFLKSGANDYLSKGFGHEEFFCRIIQNIEYLENVEAIHRAANSDYLTGLPNRRHFFTRVNAGLIVAPSAVSLAILDVDNFKQLNDAHGHDGGDKVLKEIAKLIAVRFVSHTVCRFGGEEFCIFMPHVTNEKALEILQSFCEEIAARQIVFNDKVINCTLSIGLSSDFSGDIKQTLKEADSNLYKAKQLGKNQVVG
ncbi:diguanylate cyclase [Alteromonadaceae bacterium M269]|nr:diguanylate cyclase [Alteromonadaceae bacterium M269]